MTIQEAMRVLDIMIDKTIWDYSTSSQKKEYQALEIAIKALENQLNIEDFANKAITKIHNRYKFCEKMSDYDAYTCQYISDFVKEYLEAQND